MQALFNQAKDPPPPVFYNNTALRVELSSVPLRLQSRKGQPAVSTVYISPDNIFVNKHIKLILKVYALVFTMLID